MIDSYLNAREPQIGPFVTLQMIDMCSAFFGMKRVVAHSLTESIPDYLKSL